MKSTVKKKKKLNEAVTYLHEFEKKKKKKKKKNIERIFPGLFPYLLFSRYSLQVTCYYF